MLWQTLYTVRTQNEMLKKKNEELAYKQEIINGFCDIDIYTKRTVICRICKRNANNNFANRWSELYNCFRETYHIDLPIRKDSYNIGKSKKKNNVHLLLIMQKNLVILIIYINVVYLYMNLKQTKHYNKF